MASNNKYYKYVKKEGVPTSELVKKYLLEGLKYKDISDKCFRTVKAVKWNVAKLRKIYGAKSKGDLIIKLAEEKYGPIKDSVGGDRTNSTKHNGGSSKRRDSST